MNKIKPLKPASRPALPPVPRPATAPAAPGGPAWWWAPTSPRPHRGDRGRGPGRARHGRARGRQSPGRSRRARQRVVPRQPCLRRREGGGGVGGGARGSACLPGCRARLPGAGAAGGGRRGDATGCQRAMPPPRHCCPLAGVSWAAEHSGGSPGGPAEPALQHGHASQGPGGTHLQSNDAVPPEVRGRGRPPGRLCPPLAVRSMPAAGRLRCRRAAGHRPIGCRLLNLTRTPAWDTARPPRRAQQKALLPALPAPRSPAAPAHQAFQVSQQPRQPQPPMRRAGTQLGRCLRLAALPAAECSPAGDWA